MKISLSQKQKEDAYVRRKIMRIHENLPEFIYDMIWIFFKNSTTKRDYKIKGSKISIQKKYPHYFC